MRRQIAALRVGGGFLCGGGLTHHGVGAPLAGARLGGGQPQGLSLRVRSNKSEFVGEVEGYTQILLYVGTAAQPAASGKALGRPHALHVGPRRSVLH